MNIIKRILAGAGILAGLSLASCDLTTESQSTFAEPSVFSDPTLTEYQIYSIYEVFGHTNSHRGRYLPWYGYNTDIEWYISNTMDDKADIVRYNMISTNSQLNVADGPYNELFAGIERANLTIDGIREYGDPQSRPEMAALLGEALTMRAVLYAELLKAYGEVPARFAPVTPETIYLNKSDRDDIYKQLLADLEEAIPYLSYNVATTDRVSRAFAAGMYARLALMASGYALRPDKGTVGTGNAGSVRLSDDPELSKAALYPKALEYLKDVISASGLGLEPDYEALWKSVNEMDLTGGHEIIWVIPFSNSRAGIANWYFGKYRFEWMTTHPYGGGNDDGVKPVYMRFADILLMAAEMANSSGDENGSVSRDESYAKECLRTVLRRAYRDHEADADAIVDALSGKADLIRWNCLKSSLDGASEELVAMRGKGTGPVTGFNYAGLGTYLWYRHGTVDGIPSIEMYGIHNGETAATDVIAPEGSGWVPYTNSDGEPSRYFYYENGKGAFISSDTGFDKAVNGFYDEETNPDAKQWWPIPQTTITNAQGSLYNDYGY